MRQMRAGADIELGQDDSLKIARDHGVRHKAEHGWQTGKYVIARPDQKNGRRATTLLL